MLRTEGDNDRSEKKDWDGEKSGEMKERIARFEELIAWQKALLPL